MALRIDERFVDQVTKAVVSESSSSTTLARSEHTQFSQSDTESNQWFVEAGAELTISQSPGFKISARGGYSENDTSQTTTQSARESQQVYQSSLSKAEQFAASVTREVVGASVDSYLIVENVGDVAFTVSDLEISAMLPGRTRDRFVPIATMLPAGQLTTGIEPVYNLAPLEQKGPIIISNREIYPNLVEDLMRNPRGLIFEVANYDITDEFGRHMAYQQEEVLGRTITLTIDPGDGTFQRYAVATNGAYGGRCDDGSENAGAICRDDADCLGSECEPFFFGGFDEHGTAIALPLDFVLRDVLGLQKNPSEPDAIVAGVNCRADTVAEGDDIQVVPIGTTGLNDRTIVVLAGEDGVLDTSPNNVNPSSGDDAAAKTTGYETSPTCNADTEASINEPKADGDGIASTQADGDDIQVEPVGSPVDPGNVIVSAGPNGILETVVVGDDVYVGPGEICTHVTCSGGSRDGELCDCSRGSCIPARHCVGGSNDGDWCTENVHCHDGGTCVNARYCYGGSNYFDHCSVDGDCPGGICIPARNCLGGNNDGSRCTENIHCPNGVCVDAYFCYGGSNYFGHCSPDRNCPAGECDPAGSADECRGGACDGREVLVRLENSKTGDPNRFWVVMTSEEICQDSPEECPLGIPAGSDFGDIPLRPSQAITLAFGQDIDRDGLFAREEFIYGSKDNMKDSDEDTLGDFAEIREGWEVDVVGRLPEHVFPNPRFADSDFDGLEDPREQDCLTDPTKRDTDGDGLFDVVELGITTDFNGNDEIDDFERGFGRCCEDVEGIACESEPTMPCLSNNDCSEGLDCTPYDDLTDVCPPQGVPPEWPVRLDPRNPDTDGDTIEDGEELELGLNPLDPYDADAYRDSDQDGLYDVDEQAGWEVTVKLCSNTCESAFDGVCDAACEQGTDCADCGQTTRTEPVFSSPLEGDSDFDGLPDYLESVLGTNPRDDDTDADGILDYDEFAEFGAYMNLAQIYPGFYLSPSNSQQVGTDPTSQDTDRDRLPDFFELTDGWRVLACTDDAPREVYSDPLFYDTDLDGLSDLEEYLGNDGLIAVVGACLSGAQEGEPCDPEFGCPDGACKYSRRCVGGDDDGAWCTETQADCPGGNCVTDGTCYLHKYCYGGPNYGRFCTSNNDCAGGACISSRSCVGGSNDGNWCTEPVHCPDGTCVPDDFACHGGPDDGAPCDSDDDCSASTDFRCYGGSRNGQTCECLEGFCPAPDATDPTDPDTDGDGYLDSQEAFPLGCGKNVTVTFSKYFVGADTCDETGAVFPAQLNFEFTVEHNGRKVAEYTTYPAKYACAICDGNGCYLYDPERPCRTHADCGGYPNFCLSYCVLETLQGYWIVLDNYSNYYFPSDWSTTLLMRPGDYIDIYGIVSECEAGVSSGWFPLECHGFQLRKTYDDLRSEIFSQNPSGCHSCFTDHELGLRFLVQP